MINHQPVSHQKPSVSGWEKLSKKKNYHFQRAPFAPRAAFNLPGSPPHHQWTWGVINFHNVHFSASLPFCAGLSFFSHKTPKSFLSGAFPSFPRTHCPALWATLAHSEGSLFFLFFFFFFFVWCFLSALFPPFSGAEGGNNFPDFPRDALFLHTSSFLFGVFLALSTVWCLC